MSRVRTVKQADKPVKYVVLSHYHAGAGAGRYRPIGAREIGIASKVAREMIIERGKEDWDSEYQRFPRLFQGADEIPGLTWPTMVFDSELRPSGSEKSRSSSSMSAPATRAATPSPGCPARK